MANAVSFKANKFKGKTDIMVIATMSAGGRDATLTRCSIQLWLHDDPVFWKKKSADQYSGRSQRLDNRNINFPCPNTTSGSRNES